MTRRRVPWASREEEELRRGRAVRSEKGGAAGVVMGGKQALSCRLLVVLTVLL